MAKAPAGVVENTGVPPVEKERRYIYGGAPPAAAPGYAIRRNRKAVRRNVSTFNVILLLFGIGGASVLYVNNIITINRLLSEITQLRHTYESIKNVNAALQAEVDQKSQLERISPAALLQLGLQLPRRQPIPLSIDWEKVREIRSSRRNSP